jgi:hypothetical protein
MTNTITTTSSGFADFVVRRLRFAQIQARLALNEIDTVEVSLAAGWIDGEGALEMLDEVGLGFITGTSSE